MEPVIQPTPAVSLHEEADAMASGVRGLLALVVSLRSKRHPAAVLLRHILTDLVEEVVWSLAPGDECTACNWTGRACEALFSDPNQVARCCPECSHARHSLHSNPWDRIISG